MPLHGQGVRNFHQLGYAATFANSTAIGSGATTTAAPQVSIGTASNSFGYAVSDRWRISASFTASPDAGD